MMQRLIEWSLDPGESLVFEADFSGLFGIVLRFLTSFATLVSEIFQHRSCLDIQKIF